ncbi:MAG: LCP family protein [Oscillospiraceae bacterium]
MKKKLSKPQFIIAIILSVLVLLLAAAAFVYFYYDSMLETKQSGSLPDAVQATSEETALSDTINVLVLGITTESIETGMDFTEGVGLTDIVMYVRYDLKNNKINVLQIPRDSYVGDISPTGKINAMFQHGDDQVNRIANIANVIKKDFGLSTDYYVTIDQSAFRSVIDTMGGIEMYVPWDVENGYGKIVVEQGTHLIDGATAEHIIRQRMQYSQKDFKRLEMQQYFYKAVFKTFTKDFPVSEMPKLAVNIRHYFATNFNLMELANLCIKLTSIKEEDIFMVRCPGGSLTKTSRMGKDESVYGINKENLLPLLNEHFRPAELPLTLDDLAIPSGFEYPLGETNDQGKTMGALSDSAE